MARPCPRETPASHLDATPQPLAAGSAPGAALADALRGSWRAAPPPLAVTEEVLAAIAPALLVNGVAGLVWRRLHRNAQELSRAGVLREAYRFQALRAALREREIAAAVTRLRSHGVEPLLIKGWAAARAYAEPGLRPPGDIDLCVRAAQLEAARAALRTIDAGLLVDLHLEAPSYSDRSAEDLFARSRLVTLGDTNVRVPSAADHLRLMCLHLLSHGAWKPMWLCDVAAAVEAREPDFRWEDCLAGDPRRTDAVLCVIALAGSLLGADLAGTPGEQRSRSLPGWLAPAVLRQWEAGAGASAHGPLVDRLPSLFRRPARLWGELRLRWRNPIQATFELGAPFNGFPRLPLQLAATFRRAPGFVRQAWERRRRRPS
jgi:hypothetical protein